MVFRSPAGFERAQRHQLDGLPLEAPAQDTRALIDVILNPSAVRDAEVEDSAVRGVNALTSPPRLPSS
jgi:hypothetical protein